MAHLCAVVFTATVLLGVLFGFNHYGKGPWKDIDETVLSLLGKHVVKQHSQAGADALVIKPISDDMAGQPFESKGFAAADFESFDIEGFEAFKMAAGRFTNVPSDRFNGRFAPVGKSRDGRPIFQQSGNARFMGKVRRIAWFDGHWRYYSFYDNTNKAGATAKCTFLVKSDAKHPKDISAPWMVHPSARRWVQGELASVKSPMVEVKVRGFW